MGVRAPRAGAIVPHAPPLGHVCRTLDPLREIAFDYARVLARMGLSFEARRYFPQLPELGGLDGAVMTYSAAERVVWGLRSRTSARLPDLIHRAQPHLPLGKPLQEAAQVTRHPLERFSEIPLAVSAE